MRHRSVHVLLVLLAVGLVVTPVVASSAPLDAAKLGPDELELISEHEVAHRVVDLTFSTPALDEPTTARVFLPDGYDPVDVAVRYPVLFLLHGGAGQYTDWYDEGAFALTADLPLITVLPDAGRSAWYTDWYNNGAGGTPMWETYHVDQLIPFIDGHYNTVGGRSGRAVAGLSSGGFGTMSYASRHPDLFVAAASFSGALDTNTPPVVAGKVIDGLAAQDGGIPGSLFGIREVEEVRWRGSNPWDLASNLDGMDLLVRAGNGMAGGEHGGGGPTDPGGYFLERATYDMSVSFHERLLALDIDHTWDDYGAGTHNYDYWRDGLEMALDRWFGEGGVFYEPTSDPSSFSFRSIEADYSVFGWEVVLDRSVVEFSSLDEASATGFTLTGSGSAAVTTAPLYEPGSTHVVTIDGYSSYSEHVAVADGTGRLTIEVTLGPANVVQQQFTPTHESPLTAAYETVVTIQPAP